MKISLVFLFTIAILFIGYLDGAEVYTSKYDNIDVDKILSNDRILSQYIKCLMDEGNCTNEGKELKSKCKIYLFNIKIIITFQSVK
ncbi:hypothetical protein O3M35_007024 [Rhynocoris fuscipes]|uniref:Uncharacterized protein n=1 Tax=Rhynocoris fuscipes TaxID=488301 RepID=A0AAW1DFU7_9HEMI